jgi:hypothetical protein
MEPPPCVCTSSTLTTWNPPEIRIQGQRKSRTHKSPEWMHDIHERRVTCNLDVGNLAVKCLDCATRNPAKQTHPWPCWAPSGVRPGSVPRPTSLGAQPDPASWWAGPRPNFRRVRQGGEGGAIRAVHGPTYPAILPSHFSAISTLGIGAPTSLQLSTTTTATSTSPSRKPSPQPTTTPPAGM